MNENHTEEEKSAIFKIEDHWIYSYVKEMYRNCPKPGTCEETERCHNFLTSLLRMHNQCNGNINKTMRNYSGLLTCQAVKDILTKHAIELFEKHLPKQKVIDKTID